MQAARRRLIKGFSGAALLKVLAGAGIMLPGMALSEWTKAAFEAKNMSDALKALGVKSPTDSKDIQLTGPEISENGAQVSMGLSSSLAKVSQMAILIEKNPTMLSVMFHVPEGTEPAFQTRVKMAQSSQAHALVKADGKFFMTSREFRVTTGGCAG